MESNIIKIVGQIAGIGGLALGVLLIIFRDVLRQKIFPALSKEHAFRIIRLIIVFTFLIAVIGIAAWVYTLSLAQRNEKILPEIQQQSEIQSQSNSVIVFSQKFQILNLSQEISNAKKALRQKKNKAADKSVGNTTNTNDNSVSDAIKNHELYHSIDNSMATPMNCDNPPASACLNCFPVAYGRITGCNDFALIDAKIRGEEHYSINEEDWKNGIAAHSGDEIVAIIQINNGAADNATINPIAKNVLIQFEVDNEPKLLHFIEVKVKSDNTNNLEGRFKILTAENERLEIISNSGEIHDLFGNKLLSGINMGNNILNIGDLRNRWEDAIFISFIIKVI